MARRKSLAEKYRFSYLYLSDIPYFETRYYANRFIYEVLLHQHPDLHDEDFIIMETDSGFVIMQMQPFHIRVEEG